MNKRRNLTGALTERFGYSIYESVYGTIIRRKGGASRKKILTDPAFKRVRQNNQEFKSLTTAAMLIRKGVKPLLQERDRLLVGRFNKVCNEIKNQDVASALGKRTVWNGLQTREGVRKAEGFDFNSFSNLNTILRREVVIKDGKIWFRDFVPAEDLKAPKKAARVLIRGAWLSIDVNKNICSLETSSKMLLLDKDKINFTLKPKNRTMQKQIQFVLLNIAFYERINGENYLLSEKGFYPVTLLKVI